MGEAKLNSSNEADSDFELNDLGRPDTFRYLILTHVINEEYDKAIKELKSFVEKDSEYPNFKTKVERYVLHAIDLVHAVRTKRNFPGLAQLTRTKQQELKDKFKQHFKELKSILKKIEMGIEELRVNDVKSTQILIKSTWIALLVIFIAGFFIDIVSGLAENFVTVLAESFDQAVHAIVDLIF